VRLFLPNELIKTYLDDNQLEKYRQSGLGIYSITVVATKN